MRRMRNSYRLAICSGLFFGFVGCGDDTNPDVPNRVLDRPVDLALACIEVRCDESGEGECETAALPVAFCEGESSSCDARDTPHLIGAVANSERNEIAFFQQCSGSLVDLDRRTPGYQFVPAGALPSDVVSADDSCWIASANAGSCNISVVDTRIVAATMFDVDSAEGTLSRAVSTIAPQRFDVDAGGWRPLAARLGAILSTPPKLSFSTDAPGIVVQDVSLCPAGRAKSAYVTFPTCDLVAEVDLNTQHILQSFQFVEDENGEWMVFDTGTSPVCSVDCAEQIDLEDGGALTQVAPATLAPTAVKLVQRPVQQSSDAPLDGADFAVEGQALLVGGQGADTLFEILIDDDGGWLPDTNQLELFKAGGINSIHVAPAVDFDVEGRVCDGSEGQAIDPHQFIYVVVGDGSTRVVDRALPADRAFIGVECDTQVDPTLFDINDACIPAPPNVGAFVPLQRRQIAAGPGIVAPGGARYTDWAFMKKRGELAGEESSSVPQIGTCGSVLGVGVTDVGGVTFSIFDQNRGLPEALGGDDNIPELSLLNPYLGTHMLQAETVPAVAANDVLGQWENGSLNYAALPRMVDAALTRQFPIGSGASRVLSPGLRLVDFAYTTTYSPTTSRSLLLGSIANEDKLAGEDDLDSSTEGPLHLQPVVRPWVRDYRGWPTGNWEIQWEGSIPNTASSTGLLSCDNPGWENVTCKPVDADDARLSDPSASFCDDGVISGDKLVLLGCDEDSDCGIAGACLLSSTVGAESSGICVASSALDEDPQLREACKEFTLDPCGEASREFLITRAFQSELWLQSLPQPELSFLRGPDLEDPDGSAVATCDPEGGNIGDACTNDEDCPNGLDLSCVLGGCRCVSPLQEVVGPMLCGTVQPEAGCETHAECYDLLDNQEEDPRPSVDGLRNQDFFCVDQRCRRACEDEDECLLRRLPGPRCFSEFVRYSISARNSFVVDGPGALDFFTDRVRKDPETLECLEIDGASQGVSTLLTSRVPLGPDEESLGLPECPEGLPSSTSPNPCVITTPRSESASSQFHTFTYQGDPVTAVRVSTPVGTFVLDLVDLFTLGSSLPDQPGVLWPASYRKFNRGRLPKGYRLNFGTLRAFAPLNLFGLSADGLNPLYYPVRIIPSPDLTEMFIVDATGSGSQFGLRGQVLKVFVNGISTVGDTTFDGVR